MFPDIKQVDYSYDYGDGWEIAITLVDEMGDYDSCDPHCEDGCGDNPPDDVGGEGGFSYFLEVVADEKNPEHAHMEAWGADQGYEPFGLCLVNGRIPE